MKKYRDLILYAVSFLALTLFLLTPLAADPAVLTEFPGSGFCQGLIEQADTLVISRF
jgi:hypothetical protein